MNTIFVSVAAFADTELIPTVKDLFKQADHPEKITLSVFSQDEESPRDDLLKIVNEYGAELKFEYVSLKESKGVGYARLKAQQHLLPKKHKYFLQIDSHTRFIDNWDSKIVNDYERAIQKWGDFVFSAYPGSYNYENNKVILHQEAKPPSMKIHKFTSNHACRYGGEYKEYGGDEFGEQTNYLCGGFSFGNSIFFHKHQNHPQIYYDGEEAYMSILFYADNIKIVAPPQNYIYHDYMGVPENRRFSLFVDQDFPKYKEYKEYFTSDLVYKHQQVSHVVLNDFFNNGIVNGSFNPKIQKAIADWEADWVKEIR